MKSVLLDTKLLVLWVVGLTDIKLIARHKRTRKEFTVLDFELLQFLLKDFNVLWITSHCLAEASNFLKQTHSQQASKLLGTLANLSHIVRESHNCFSIVVSNEYFQRMGVADTGIIQKSKRVSCLITVDFDLYVIVSKSATEVVNFNHLRQEYL